MSEPLAEILKDNFAMLNRRRTKQEADSTRLRAARVTRSIVNLARAGLRFSRRETVIDLDVTSSYAHRDLTPDTKASRGELMSAHSSHDVTRLLQEWRNGDRGALEKLTPIVYDELRRLAANYLRGERPGHTLQGTALVHEAYMRMVGYTNLEWQNRAHFYGVAARVMRQILIDHARKHQTGKRGGGQKHLPLEEATIFSAERADDLVALDDALEALATFDAQKGRIIELRYFGGLSIEDICEVTGASESSVRRHMRMAEAWLHREMTGVRGG